jgi:hypothetical protein
MWRPDWVQPIRLPLAIRIEMAPLDTVNQSDLRVGTVTALFNVSRDPRTRYTDFDFVQQ